ncbi:MAG TPA: hypothetical protein VFE32_03965 [Puia sp.]|jgi:hypothetical protein|nr:hypothetical protein [Puia sp.]
MKKTICLFLSAICLLLCPVAYSQTPNPLYQHLPPKADHIYDINFSQINSKGNLLSVLSGLPQSNNPHFALIFDILKDPASAGIDLSHHIIIAQSSATGAGADTLAFTNIVLQLSDSAKFRVTLKKVIPDLHIHRLPGKGASAAHEHLALAWNDNVVVFTLAAHEGAITDAASASADSKTPRPHPAPSAVHRPVAEIATEKSLAALAGFPTSPWTTDQRFLTGFASDADMHFWSTGMNMGRFFAKMAAKMAKKNGMSPAMPGNFPNIPSGPANTPIFSTFNFADGRIVFHMTVFNQPGDAATMRRFVDHPFNKDLIARLPDGRLLGYMAMHINPAAYKDVLDKYHTRNLVDSMLQKKGLSIDDFTSAFSGDFLVAALAPDSVATTDTAKKKVRFYLVAGVNDPAKLMQLASKLSGVATANPDTSKPHPFKDFANKMVVQDNLLVISGSREQAMSYFTHPGRRSTDNIDVSNNMQSLVIDMKAISNYIGSSMASDPKAMIFARILEKLDKITLTSGLMDGDNTEMTFQIITAEPSNNSLATLLSILH